MGDKGGTAGNGVGTPGKEVGLQIVLVAEGCQWSKPIRVPKETTGKELLASVRERVKADGVKIPPVELQAFALYVQAPGGALIEDKKKVSKYKLSEGAVVEFRANGKDGAEKPRSNTAPSADMKDERHICMLEFPEGSFKQNVQIDLSTKVSDLIATVVKAHPVDAVENFALTTVIEGARVVLPNEATLGSQLKKGEKALRKLELLTYERVYNKLAFVIGDREVSLRLPVQVSAREAIGTIFEKFGEDVKKAEHFALVMCPRTAPRMVGLLLDAGDMVGTYKLRTKEARFHLKYHRKDIADLQLQRIKLDALKSAAKTEQWLSVEAKDANQAKATILADGELSVADAISAAADYMGVSGSVEGLSMWRGKVPLERSSKVGGFGMSFGEKIALKRKEKEGDANNPASPAVKPEPKVAPAMYKKSDNPADGVFGVDPSTLELVDDSGYKVPAVLRQLKECLMSHDGLITVGIFRVEGHNLKMKQLQAEVNAHKVVDMADHVHEASSLIKRYYDDLPGKLLGSIPDDVLDQASSLEGALTIADKLPRMQRDLFNWLVALLAQVAANKEVNKMDASNLGIVFGPLLALSRNPIHALVQTGKVVQLVALNIQHPPVPQALSTPTRSRAATDTQPEESILSPEQLKQLEQLEKLQSDRPELFHKKQRGAIRAVDITSLMADTKNMEEELRRHYELGDGTPGSNTPGSNTPPVAAPVSDAASLPLPPAAAVPTSGSTGEAKGKDEKKDVNSKDEKKDKQVDSSPPLLPVTSGTSENLRDSKKRDKKEEKKDKDDKKHLSPNSHRKDTNDQSADEDSRSEESESASWGGNQGGSVTVHKPASSLSSHHGSGHGHNQSSGHTSSSRSQNDAKARQQRRDEAKKRLNGTGTGTSSPGSDSGSPNGNRTPERDREGRRTGSRIEQRRIEREREEQRDREREARDKEREAREKEREERERSLLSSLDAERISGGGSTGGGSGVGSSASGGSMSTSGRVTLVPKTVPKAQARPASAVSSPVVAHPRTATTSVVPASTSCSPPSGNASAPSSPSPPATSATSSPSASFALANSSSPSQARRDSSPANARRTAESPELHTAERTTVPRKSSSMKKADFKAARDAKDRKEKDDKDKDRREKTKSDR